MPSVVRNFKVVHQRGCFSTADNSSNFFRFELSGRYECENWTASDLRDLQDALKIFLDEVDPKGVK